MLFLPSNHVLLLTQDSSVVQALELVSTIKLWIMAMVLPRLTDNGVWSGLLGFTRFNEDYGKFDPVTGTTKIPTTWQSIGTGTPQAGIALICLVATPLATRFSQKICFLTLAAIAIVGIIIQATATNYWQLIAGRIINSVSMGIVCKYV